MQKWPQCISLSRFSSQNPFGKSSKNQEKRGHGNAIAPQQFMDPSLLLEIEITKFRLFFKFQILTCSQIVCILSWYNCNGLAFFKSQGGICDQVHNCKKEFQISIVCLGGCMITSKTKINVFLNFFEWRVPEWNLEWRKNFKKKLILVFKVIVQPPKPILPTQTHFGLLHD